MYILIFLGTCGFIAAVCGGKILLDRRNNKLTAEQKIKQVKLTYSEIGEYSNDYCCHIYKIIITYSKPKYFINTIYKLDQAITKNELYRKFRGYGMNHYEALDLLQQMGISPDLERSINHIEAAMRACNSKISL